MDFKYNLNVERIKDADKKVNETRDGFGSKSGFYLTLIEYIAVLTNDKGSKTLNFKLSNQDRSQSIVAYLRMTNNDGKPSFQAPLLDKLMTILEIDELTTNKEDVKLYATLNEYDVIQEIKEKVVCIQLEREWSKYNGKLYSKNNIRNFFRAKDYATAKEILEAKDFGKYFNSVKDYENFNKVKYVDTNEEEVKYFLQHKELPKQKSNIAISEDEIPF